MTNLDEHVLEEAGDRHERLTVGELVTLIERHDPDQGPGITRETIREYAEELANRDAPVYPEKVDDAIDDRLREAGSASGPVSWTGSTTLFSVGEDRVSAFPTPWHEAFTTGNATMREVVEFALREPGAISGTGGATDTDTGVGSPAGAPEAGKAPKRGRGESTPSDGADGAGADGDGDDADGAEPEEATADDPDADGDDGDDAGEGDVAERDEGVADPVDEESDGDGDSDDRDDADGPEDGAVDADAGSEEGVESDDPETGATAEDVDPDHDEGTEVTEGADAEDQVAGEDNVGEMDDSGGGAAEDGDTTADDVTPDADEPAEAEEGAESGGAGSDPVFEGPQGVPRQVILNAATLFGDMEWPEAQGELEELRGEGVVVEDLDQHPNPNVRLADEEEGAADRVQER